MLALGLLNDTSEAPMTRSLALSLVLLAGAPTFAAAQTTGVIITPTYTTGTPAPQPYVQAPVVSYAPAYGMQCPDGSAPQPDRRGIIRCMHLVNGHRVTWGLAGAGIGLLAGGWVIEILTTAFSSIDSHFGTRADYVGWGYVPLVGPWIQMTDVPPGTLSSYYVWLGFEGLLQDAGLILMIFGLVGEDYEEYQPIAAGDVRVRPIFSASTQGIAVTGAF
jgi:hypothetical protein